MTQFNGFNSKKKMKIFMMTYSKNSEILTILCLMLSMINLCFGEPRQYGDSRNDLFTRPGGRANRRNGGQMKLLTPDESNADVLKELGVDLSKEGKKSLFFVIEFEKLSLTEIRRRIY